MKKSRCRKIDKQYPYTLNETFIQNTHQYTFPMGLKEETQSNPLKNGDLSGTNGANGCTFFVVISYVFWRERKNVFLFTRRWDKIFYGGY